MGSFAGFSSPKKRRSKLEFRLSIFRQARVNFSIPLKNTKASTLLFFNPLHIKIKLAQGLLS
jgi:hypothetical protein